MKILYVMIMLVLIGDAYIYLVKSNNDIKTDAYDKGYVNGMFEGYSMCPNK